MIFWIGFTIMFFNESFVIMRHVSPWFAQKRKQLHNRFGKEKIKTIHGFTDWGWVGFITLGYILDFQNWKLYTTALVLYWGTIALVIYLPMLIKKKKKQPTGYVD